MFCLSRDKPIQLPNDELDAHLEAVYYPEANEKQLLPPGRPGEEEMQKRLSDLRDQISDAKLDW